MQSTELVTLKIGKMEYKVSKQAQVVFYLYMIGVIVSIITFFINPNHFVNIINLIVALITLILGTYATNCLVVGQCNTYAWVIVGVATLYALINASALIYLLAMKNSKMEKPKTRISKRK